MALVFVYGSLKRGFPLHRVLEHSEFIDEAVTLSDTFDMFPGGGFPYLWKGEYWIKGELYNVSNETLQQLDYIEGVPTHYQRIALDVKTFNLFYSEHNALAYMAAKDFGFTPGEHRRIGFTDGVKEWLEG